MRTAATRWQLLELQRQRVAVLGGIELLDRKREALIRELTERRDAAARARIDVERSLRLARAALQRAIIEIGAPAAHGAALAQPPAPGFTLVDDAVLGVRIPRPEGAPGAFRAHYGPGGTCAALDDAGAAYVALLPEVVALAAAERAQQNLRRGLHRTTRTLNALKIVVLRSIDERLRTVRAGLEEEEREEAVRWRAGVPRASMR